MSRRKAAGRTKACSVRIGTNSGGSSAGDSITGRFKNAVTYPPPAAPPQPGRSVAPPPAEQPAAPVGSRTSFEFRRRRPTFGDQELEKRLEEQGVAVTALDEGETPWCFNLLLGCGPTVLLIGAFVWLSRRTAAAASGGLFSLGCSRAKRYAEKQPTVTFDDVAGIDEVENELTELVDFLKQPLRYQRLGGTVPKGDGTDARSGSAPVSLLSRDAAVRRGPLVSTTGQTPDGLRS